MVKVTQFLRFQFLMQMVLQLVFSLQNVLKLSFRIFTLFYKYATFPERRMPFSKRKIQISILVYFHLKTQFLSVYLYRVIFIKWSLVISQCWDLSDCLSFFWYLSVLTIVFKTNKQKIIVTKIVCLFTEKSYEVQGSMYIWQIRKRSSSFEYYIIYILFQIASS